VEDPLSLEVQRMNIQRCFRRSGMDINAGGHKRASKQYQDEIRSFFRKMDAGCTAQCPAHGIDHGPSFLIHHDHSSCRVGTGHLGSIHLYCRQVIAVPLLVSHHLPAPCSDNSHPLETVSHYHRYDARRRSHLPVLNCSPDMRGVVIDTSVRGRKSIIPVSSEQNPLFCDYLCT
jgi:hypothetical protein